MRINFILSLLFSVNCFAQNGIVNIETEYQDVTNPSSNVKFHGQGFIVEYPIRSHITNNTTNLKVVLTAAHLVFGGIYTNRLDNFRIYESGSQKQIYALGMISDVIHDSAAIILCTQETMSFIEREFNAYGIDLGDIINQSSGQIFNQGGGCSSQNERAEISDVNTSFARYFGRELVFSSQEGRFLEAQRTDTITSLHSQILVNQNFNGAFLSAGQMYAVPWINQSIQDDQTLLQIEDLLSTLQPISNWYMSLQEVPGEFNIPLSLAAGYSGSPVITFSYDSNQLIVSGIYKSSTQSANHEPYANFGWVSPTELSEALLGTFLSNYTQTLHRWQTLPQAYLYLNQGHLVREMYYNHFILSETPELNPEITPEDAASSTGWVRSDTGVGLWARSDTGSSYSIYPRKSKSLMLRSRDGSISEPLLMMSIDRNNNILISKKIILPPVIEAVHFTTKYNCVSCVNSRPYSPNNVNFYTYNEPSRFIEMLWQNLALDRQSFSDAEIAKIYTNASEIRNLSQIEIKHSIENNKLKIEIVWSTDSISFYILENNNFLFMSFDGQWHESGYLSVLETQTNSGDFALLELAGIIYFNTELENENSFRLKLMNQDTQLFNLQEL